MSQKALLPPLLLIALLTLPAAAAGCYTAHLRSMMILGAVFNSVFVISGLVASSLLSLPSGPTIVMISGVVYVISVGIKKLRSK